MIGTGQPMEPINDPLYAAHTALTGQRASETPPGGSVTVETGADGRIHAIRLTDLARRADPDKLVAAIAEVHNAELDKAQAAAADTITRLVNDPRLVHRIAQRFGDGRGSGTTQAADRTRRRHRRDGVSTTRVWPDSGNQHPGGDGPRPGWWLNDAGAGSADMTAVARSAAESPVAADPLSAPGETTARRRDTGTDLRDLRPAPGSPVSATPRGPPPVQGGSESSNERRDGRTVRVVPQLIRAARTGATPSDDPCRAHRYRRANPHHRVRTRRRAPRRPRDRPPARTPTPTA